MEWVSDLPFLFQGRKPVFCAACSPTFPIDSFYDMSSHSSTICTSNCLTKSSALKKDVNMLCFFPISPDGISSHIISSHLISCPSTPSPTALSSTFVHSSCARDQSHPISSHLISSHLVSPLLCHPGCSPDAFTYNTVINVYGREGQMEEAEAVLQQMRARGCIPDRVSPQRVRNF